MKELLTNLFNFFGLAWWVEIVTANPHCTYYFGPFLTAKEAEAEKDGYIEDLESENAQSIKFEILRCKPRQLTVEDEDLGKKTDLSRSSILRNQVFWYFRNPVFWKNRVS
jgi:hypothetical protein